jgi:hypothetical protein
MATFNFSKLQMTTLAFGAAVLMGLASIQVAHSDDGIAGPPPESGVVLRYDGLGFYWRYDQESDSTVYFGIDPLIICTQPFPAGYDAIPTMEVLMNTDDEALLRFKQQIRGELQTSVWDGFAPPVCGPIIELGLTPIANGSSHFKLNDNDLIPSLNPDGHNFNSYGYNANGVLLNYDTGEPMRFMTYFHATWDGESIDSFRSIQKVKLK